ncbi:hypothetical protein BCR33DRAFT_1842 [Rhizoclosmatium globosum]|uniref:Uncharacterized protein n=1 Tax=Rhizoclosmatium globosum TaxID=329046 RepID=A0A1Y2D2I7_9FUNG|nr:hypothetical protein BCR33DRAFT_1842 [Rhizoclosmatium globosum]|eukprot:ORY53508.1 hypothetical protein BCR33DRAFT_1842 [Rhizoclosmatium globosum]
MIHPTTCIQHEDPCKIKGLYGHVCENPVGPDQISIYNQDTLFLTQCPQNSLYCDIQQIVPKKWAHSKNLKESSSCKDPELNLLEVINEGTVLTESAAGGWVQNVLKKVLTAHEQIAPDTATSLLTRLNDPTSPSLAYGFPQPFDTRPETQSMFIITPTKKEPNRAQRIGRNLFEIKKQVRDNLLQCKFRHKDSTVKCRNLVWVLAESMAEVDHEVVEMLKCAQVPFVYFAVGANSPETAAKNALVQFVVEFANSLGFKGLLRPLSEGSYALARSYDLAYKVNKFGYLPVWGVGGKADAVDFVAKKNGQVTVTAARLPKRKFPLEFSGMVINTGMFDKTFMKGDSKYWPYPGEKVGNDDSGISEFVGTVITSVQDIEETCKDKCQVVFNEPPVDKSYPMILAC